MQAIVKYFLMILWLLFFSISFLWVWSKVPALWLVNLPDATYASLMRAFGVIGPESAEYVQIFIALGLGLVLASIILSLFLFVRKRKIRTNGTQQTTR